MTRNNADFHDQVSPEAIGNRQLFHVSPKANRTSIESQGLKPQPQHGWGPKGVYMNLDKPLAQYGDDAYEVTPRESTPLFYDKNDFGKAVYSKKSIPVSDIKRVGHVFFPPQPRGGVEVHLHLEEDCNGKSIHD